MRDMKTEAAFQSYLFPGERIRWSGRPKQGTAFGARDVFLIPFSLLWGGFAIFWNVMVWSEPFGGGDGAPPLFFRLWGLPFLIVGLYLIAGRFVHDAWLRKALRYAVSDQRILILRNRKFSSFDIERLPRLDLTEHRDGTGTIDFGPANIFSAMNGMDWWVPALNRSGQFFRIAAPREVYRLIREPRA
ncbi:hypothetical protein [Sphingomonas sp. Leaf4]|uniref:hypothetical protein n=1 Tax=Sphingomonas sp. Leaf4 TaxID=2876553 RepID=UPI001E5A3A1D|nr:hypothetical protein [Sphingomonas sp. Leaf4]